MREAPAPPPAPQEAPKPKEPAQPKRENEKNEPKRDETTNQPIVPRDETGQPIVPRDETGQPLRKRDELGALIPDEEADLPQSPASLLRPGTMLGAGGLDEDGRINPGGTDYMAQVAIIEGYNSNVIQTQDVPGGPARKHPSPFTGIDASAALRTWSSPYDEHELRLQFRGQHYTPLDSFHQPDDASVNAGWAGQFTLGAKTVLTARVLGAITSVNSSRLSDGPLFQLDPTSVQRTYSLAIARFALQYEISPRWRFVQGADVELSTTLKDAPISTPEGTTIHHRGLDFVQPGLDSAIFHDLDDRNILGFKVRYAPIYNAFVLDYSATPPRTNGHAYTNMFEGEATLIHAFSERLRTGTTLGWLVSDAPPLDPDRRPIMSPLLTQEVTYLKQYWIATANVSYAYGSANPRLGFGPSATAGFTIEGTPFPNGSLRYLDLLINGITTRAAFQQGDGAVARLTLTQVGAEARYGLTPWLGLMAGYGFRYATFEGAETYPPLARHLVFLGVSGYFTTTRTLPTLQTFVSPVTPPG